MKLFYILLLAIPFSTAIAQTDDQIDSLAKEVCHTLDEKKSLDDSSQLISVYGKQFLPFVGRFYQFDSDQGQQLMEKIYYRSQRNCPDFGDLLARLSPPSPSTDDWERVKTKPKPKLKKTLCTTFLDREYFTYPDSNGDTVKLTIKDNLWIDHYKDGTYSKLTFQWTSNCEFDSQFIDTDNPIQEMLNRKGDVYHYQIIDQEKNYYLMSVEADNSGVYYLFHLYY